MYLFDFFKQLTKKSNIGLIIWLVLNTALLAALFSNGFQGWEGVVHGLSIYIVSLMIALSPIGEWILRLQNGCRKLTGREGIERLKPIFREVCAKVKQANQELPNDIKMFISDSKEPNAFATGRKTDCVIKGLLNYSDEQIKGEYGDYLCQVFESFCNGGGTNGLFAALASSHLNTNQRIAKVQELGRAYKRCYPAAITTANVTTLASSSDSWL